ncbi:MAG: TIGR00159 family protein [Alphaproteobacteria bacterium]|nr:TIGR00159 family protein [Alphaproteobacteria bacterium]
MQSVWSWFAESPFTTASWVDWIDILLLAAVIYRILLVLRGTRAMQSLIGLLLLVGLYAVARIGGLTTMSWVLDNVFVYLVLAVLILFQQDIRRALANAGGRFFVSRLPIARADATILEEVIKAAFALSRRKIGALIVLEGNASLDAWIEGSNEVDGKVSHELLQSIFHPAGPMHDGAVVIRKDRIAAAGVFLPISLSKQISRTFGTRHRAAIGLTEITDALCIVVSEERGTVAIVVRGEIVPVADMNDLRHNLTEQLDRQADEPSNAGVASA